jgi:hypothetical protein
MGCSYTRAVMFVCGSQLHGVLVHKSCDACTLNCSRDGKIRHHHIRQDIKTQKYFITEKQLSPSIQKLVEDHKFPSIQELIEYHKLNGLGLNTRLWQPPTQLVPNKPQLFGKCLIGKGILKVRA